MLATGPDARVDMPRWSRHAAHALAARPIARRQDDASYRCLIPKISQDFFDSEYHGKQSLASVRGGDDA